MYALVFLVQKVYSIKMVSANFTYISSITHQNYKGLGDILLHMDTARDILT